MIIRHYPPGAVGCRRPCPSCATAPCNAPYTACACPMLPPSIHPQCACIPNPTPLQDGQVLTAVNGQWVPTAPASSGACACIAPPTVAQEGQVLTVVNGQWVASPAPGAACACIAPPIPTEEGQVLTVVNGQWIASPAPGENCACIPEPSPLQEGQVLTAQGGQWVANTLPPAEACLNNGNLPVNSGYSAWTSSPYTGNGMNSFAGNLHVTRIEIDCTITIASVAIAVANITGFVPGAPSYICLYDATGALIFQSQDINPLLIGVGLVIVSLPAPLTLDPGILFGATLIGAGSTGTLIFVYGAAQGQFSHSSTFKVAAFTGPFAIPPAQIDMNVTSSTAATRVSGPWIGLF